MVDETQPQSQASSGYGKRPLWQWILLYVVIAAIVYGAVYYFFLSKNGYKQTGSEYPNQQVTVTAQPTTAVSASPSAAQEIIVSGSEFAFTPSSVTVKMGQPVQLTFKNIGKYPHNLTITDLGVATKTIQPGLADTVTFTPSKAGTYTFMCTVPGHADRGMKGTLVVQ